MPDTILIFGKYLYLYDLCGVIALTVFLILGDWLGKKYSFSYAKSFLYVVLAWGIRYALLYITSFIVGGGTMSGLNHVRIVVALPILLFPFVRLLKDNFWKVTDFIAPLISIFHGIVCLGCMFSGCCHGYPSDWGIYSNLIKTTCFPLQPIEAAVNIIIGLVLLIMALRKKQEGRLYAWYLALFGSTRILLEFLRDNEKILMGFSEYAIHAIIAFVVGITALLLLSILKKKGVKTYEKKSV